MTSTGPLLPSLPYHRTPIKQGEIRLLLLAPGTGQEPLTGRFYVASLERPPSYRAISYAWGNAVLSCHLRCSGSTLGITQSLDGALRRLRSKADCVALWADAVCINQADSDEKGRQVALMYNIYLRAQSVAIWLGPMMPDDPDAFWILELLEEMLHTVTQTIKSKETALYYFFEYQHSAVRGFPSRKCRCCGLGQQQYYTGFHSIKIGTTALASLLERAYFTRLWVVPEIVAGLERLHIIEGDTGHARYISEATGVQVYCGSHKVSYNVLISAIRANEWLPLEALPDIWEGPIARVTALDQFMQSFRQTGNSAMRLLDAMMAARDMLCSDARDLVFAFRAMTRVENSALLRADYDVHVEIVWLRTAAYLLTEADATGGRSAAEVLAIASTQRTGMSDEEAVTKPSWVTSFDRLNFDSELKHVVYGFDPQQTKAGGDSTFAAHRDPAHPRVLHVHGRIIDQIATQLRGSYHYRPAYITDMGSYWQFVERGLIPRFAEYHRFLTAVGQKDTAICLQSRAFLRHGTPDSDGEGQISNVPDWVPRFRAINDDLPHPCPLEPLTVLHSLSSLLRVVKPTSDSDTDGETEFWYNDDWIDCTQILACTARGRGCWVPNFSKVGDFICVLQGAPYPFVLRHSHAGQYTVIGDAYVHGIIGGEAWTDDAAFVGDIMLV